MSAKSGNVLSQKEKVIKPELKSSKLSGQPGSVFQTLKATDCSGHRFLIGFKNKKINV